MSARDDYFARVRPLLGRGLGATTIAIERPALTGRVVELLAGCLLSRVIVADAEQPAGWPLTTLCRGHRPRGRSAGAWLGDYLAWKNSFTPMTWLRRGEPEVTVGARLLLPGAAPFVVWDEPQRRVTLHLVAGDLWGYEQVAVSVARDLRDLLLGRRAWPRGVRYYGSALWPFGEGEIRPSAAEPEQVTLPGKRLMLVGLGSVGSEVARRLVGRGCRWTLVDDGVVSVFNPHRQWYGCDEIGRAKTDALAARLAPEPVRRVQRRLDADSVAALVALIEADRPDLCVLTTGTDDDAALAGALWQRGVPHLAAYAYPQARFFELAVVLPEAETPCLACLRGHLWAGSEPRTPVTDEVAHFLYQEPDAARRAAAYQNLVAEPATPVETNRLAAVVAQTAAQALAAPVERARWFARLCAAKTTCLLGGNVADELSPGVFAYGITRPGQVVRLGLDDLTGASARRTCEVCGRALETAVPLALPACADAEVDAALLAG